MGKRNETRLLMYQKLKAPKRLLNSVHLRGGKRFQNCEWKIKSSEWQFLRALNCLLASNLNLLTYKSIGSDTMYLNTPRTLQYCEDTTAVTNLIHWKTFYQLVILEVCVSFFTIFDIQRIYRHFISMTDIILISYEGQLRDFVPPMRDRWHYSLHSADEGIRPRDAVCSKVPLVRAGIWTQALWLPSVNLSVSLPVRKKWWAPHICKLGGITQCSCRNKTTWNTLCTCKLVFVSLCQCISFCSVFHSTFSRVKKFLRFSPRRVCKLGRNGTDDFSLLWSV